MIEIEMKEKKDESSNSSVGLRAKNILYMQKLENKLNGEIGFNWWKRYISSAFWDNLGTPINLTITLLTAVSAAQVSTGNLMSPYANSVINLVTLILSTLNTFFRPHTKVSSNMEIMKKYSDFGNKFEEIYYSVSSSDENYKDKTHMYKNLLVEINTYENNHGSEAINFCSDFIHIFLRYLCLKTKEKWLDLDKEFEEHKE
jgi:hypothetical protein